MLFNSYGFIFLFLPISITGYYQLARLHHSYAAAWLAISSLFFYGYWNPAYVGLLMGSIMCNYAFGIWIAKAGVRHMVPRKKRILTFAVTSNILLLGYYKYANFFLSSANSLTNSSLSLSDIILPLGISFFTFTQIAFLIDTFQGKVKEYNFIHYVLFVTYFPHLIAGPVLHHKDMMPQFARNATYRINWDNVATGLLLFTLGLCKKVLWADSLAPFAASLFDGTRSVMLAGTAPTVWEAWLGALAYTLQIYFDFSGYTDMALGIALMFNIHLPINFNSPYKSTNIIEFWRRWHITLSTFLRDYLYIPLGGNRHGKARRYLNLLATMLLGGLWHGAGWTFIVWGGVHGVYLTVNHLWRDLASDRYLRWLPDWLGLLTGGLLTFISVVSAWVVFRAENLAQAAVILKAMFGINARPFAMEVAQQSGLQIFAGLPVNQLLYMLALGLLWVWLLPNSARIRYIQGGSLSTVLQAAALLVFLGISIFQFGSYSPFLYFQF